MTICGQFWSRSTYVARSFESSVYKDHGRVVGSDTKHTWVQGACMHAWPVKCFVFHCFCIDRKRNICKNRWLFGVFVAKCFHFVRKIKSKTAKSTAFNVGTGILFILILFYALLIRPIWLVDLQKVRDRLALCIILVLVSLSIYIYHCCDRSGMRQNSTTKAGI